MNPDPAATTEVIKQAPNAATVTRTATAVVATPTVVTFVAWVITYMFEVIHYYSPGFPEPDWVNNPVALSFVASLIAAAPIGIASYMQRGTTILKRFES